MVYSVVVRDIAGKEVPGALLTFVDAAGMTVGSIRTSNGWFSIDDQAHPELAADDVTFTVSAPGYKTDTGWAVSDLDPTVNNRITVLKSNSTMLLLGGGIAAGLLLAGISDKKKRKKVGGFFDNINPKVKIGILVAGGLAAYYILSKDKSGSKLPITSKAELDQLASQGIVPTFDAAQAEAMSNSLTSAFAGCGTDEDTVYQIIGMLKNKADLLLLIYVYDVRSYQGCFEGMIWEENVTANLSQALSNELSSSELAKVNGILSSNGIAFSF